MLAHILPHSSEIIDLLVKETMPLGYVVWDAEGNGLDCSPSVLQLFGLPTPEEVFANWDRLSPAIQPNGLSSKIYFEETFVSTNVSGKIVLAWQHLSINGEPIPVEVTCVRHSIRGNIFIIAHLRDLRTSLYLQQDIDSEHPRLASILRSCPICFAILSGDHFSFATPFMCNFLGIKIGDSFSSIIADSEMTDWFLRELSENDIVSWVPMTIRTRYGDLKEMLAYALCFDETENSEKIVWLIDITQSRRLESELKIAKDAAEAATKAKSEFLANMSHEIRTPMNAIIGLTHLTLQTSLTEQQTEYVETVQQSAHILLRLINDILDFSKIEAGRMILEYRKFFIGTIISEITAVASVPMQKKGLEFQIDVDAALPMAIMGDSVRLHQVILNLLNNATKFTEKGTIRLCVESVESDGLSVVLRFSVSDTGIGMTPVQITGLFQPFSQATASTTRQFGGTGLGLAISKRIVEMMGGEISCCSEPGDGATFTFTARFGIPLEGEVVTVDDSTEIRTDALLVGDVPQDKTTMAHFIELLGSVKTYQIGAELAEFHEVLETGKIRDVDFIIFDFSPETRLVKNFIPMYEIMHEKALDPMPMCVITEHPELELVLNELGINDSVQTLKKPISAGDLFNIVASVAEHKKQLRREHEASGILSTSYGEKDVVIPKSLLGSKILLAEDNKINQMVATELLRIKGFKTTVADNGRIALELLKTQSFDLVLMDVQMPEMNGFEATRAIRSDPKLCNIPILAMTANAMSGDQERCLEAGMNAHIAKPIEPNTFYQALVKWIRK